MGAADTGYRAQFVKNKILIMFHVFRVNFEQKVEISRDVITFYNLLQSKNIFNKLITNGFIVLFQFDINKDDQSVV